MTIGDRIKQRRIQIGLTVDQLADKIGKNRATVYRYESNEIEKFPLDILYPLADALHTTPAFLMGWESDGLIPNNAPRGELEVSDKNIIRIAARNGVFKERILSDEQLAIIKGMLDQMPDASGDL